MTFDCISRCHFETGLNRAFYVTKIDRHRIDTQYLMPKTAERIFMELNEMSKSELTDMFIADISGHEKEAEIALILAVYTAMKLPLAQAISYEVQELDTFELIELIEDGILNNNCGFDEEDKAWNLVFAALKPDEVMEIIDNIDNHIKRYHKIIHPLEQLNFILLKTFVEKQ